MITLLILITLVGAGAVSMAPRGMARLLALIFNAATLLLALGLWRGFDPMTGGLQLIERHDWIPAIGAEYRFGIDGLSLLLVLLTSLVFPFAFLAQKVDRTFCSLLLIMQASLYGTFTAQNFVLWFLFYEMSLIPAYLLIKLWGGANRDRAAMKFFVYTFLGSVGMLLAFLVIYRATGTFNFVTLTQTNVQGSLMAMLGNNSIGLLAPWLVFAGIFIGLAVKVPLFPFHTWQPDAYSTAPTGVSMVMSGVLSKMGVYGFIRLLLPLFPHQLDVLGPWLLVLAVCSVVFSSLAAWAQTDLKRMVAYLSITHLGYCMLAIFSIGAAHNRSQIDITAALSGVFIQLASHGITAATLFYYIGLLEERRGKRGLADFGGLMQCAPLFCGWMGLAIFSLLGLPGLNGFIGEFLIFKGSFVLAPVASSVAVIGLLVTVVVLLRAMQSLFSGPLTKACEGFPELTTCENWIILPFSLIILWIGVAPQFLFHMINSTVVRMAHFLH
ncbi:MAG: NADH-quinone oxidoreductase subunit M [Chthoniobacteraceae bacterium]